MRRDCAPRSPRRSKCQVRRGPIKWARPYQIRRIRPVFFLSVLEYSIFPRARSPVFADNFGVAKRDIAWDWITGQLKKYVMGEKWAKNASKVADILARTFSLMGKRRVLPHFSKTKAGEWFDIWRMINEERMNRNNWSFVGPKEVLKSHSFNLPQTHSIPPSSHKPQKTKGRKKGRKNKVARNKRS